MDLSASYAAVSLILDTVDFNALSAGFRRYRFALYSNREVVLDGKTMPFQDEFLGNTSILYEGEYIAIWNMEADPVEDPERLAYCLIHEMFHCHQRTNNETRYPSDLDLLCYPDDIEHFTYKYNENRYLADAYEQQDMELLRKFAYIRELRYKAYPAMVRQEWNAETLEGMAEYIGLKALERINAEKYCEIIRSDLALLREESDLLFDVRRIAYYTGAIFFLCLERCGVSVVNDFSEETAYEQNRIDIAGVSAQIRHCDFIAARYERLLAEKKRRLEEYIRRSEYVESSAVICGYDPMNMFRLGDLIYCSHFVCLDEGGEIKMLRSATVLKLAEGSNRNVIGYYAAEA